MAIRNKTELQAEITTYIKSGGSPSLTSGADLRTLLTDVVDTLFGAAGYPFAAIASPTGSAPTVTVDCASEFVVSKTLAITSGSTGNVTLALSNAVNGVTLTLHITNNDSVSRSVLLPADAAHIDFSGNAKTIPVAAGKSVVMGVTYTGSKYLWSLNTEV